MLLQPFLEMQTLQITSMYVLSLTAAFEITPPASEPQCLAFFPKWRILVGFLKVKLQQDEQNPNSRLKFVQSCLHTGGKFASFKFSQLSSFETVSIVLT